MHYRYVIPIGKQQLWVEGDAPNNAGLFAQVAELADVFPDACGYCGSSELIPRTFRGQYLSYELACRACGYRLRINSRKDGGLYIKERAWQPPFKREGDQGEAGAHTQDGAASGDDPPPSEPGYLV